MQEVTTVDGNRLTAMPEMPELTFEEQTHTYRLDGVIIPSVSAVMEPLSRSTYRRVDDKTLDKAANKGSSVHSSIEFFINYGVEDVNPAHKGYFDAFLDWWNLRKPEVVGCENYVYHKIYRYGGTVDLLAYIDGKLTLVDFKTTSALLEKTCGVQLEAYAQALKNHGIEVEQKMILHLKKTGKYAEKFFEVNDKKRWLVFGSLKVIYDYDKSYEK